MVPIATGSYRWRATYQSATVEFDFNKREVQWNCPIHGMDGWMTLQARIGRVPAFSLVFLSFFLLFLIYSTPLHPTR